MTRKAVLDELRRRFGDQIVALAEPSDKRVYLEIKPQALLPVATCVFKELAARFNIATGIDNREELEILYHFTLEPVNLLLSLRVRIGKENPRIDSLAPLFKGADWIEREMHELLGIEFEGHPDLRRLLLPEEWPKGLYPLRRDYREWDKRAIRDRGV